MDCSKKGLIKIHNKSREQKAIPELSRPSRRSPPSAWRRTGGWLLPVLAAIIFAPPFAPTVEAQTVLVSNVGQTRSGSLGLDTHEGAQAFTTGDNSAGYTVTSVGLDMSSGADRTINFTVGIWTNSNSNLPGSSLVTLTQPASLISGVNEFTTSGITLAANTTYWVVVDSTGGGSAQWEGTASDSEGPTSLGWSIADESYDRTHDGDTWSSYTDPFKLRVTGTAIGSAMNNAPVFTEGTSTTRSVAENTASGQNIGAPVMATDTDTSDTLTYTLGGTDAADFGIVSSNGQLQTSAALNYETKDSYEVTVSVSDGNAGEDSIDVTINVTDVDEPNSAPVFTEGTSTTRSVAENTASGQNIGVAVMATDTDTSDTLTYTLGGTDAADFGIVRSSGQLQTSAALNYETKDSYAVTVSVSDGNAGEDSIDVTINVTDVDEPNSAPVFTEGTSTTRSVAENTASGQNIGAVVTATDADTTDTLTYTLGGTDAADFGIVRSSGQLQTSAALNFETKASYAVTVSVSDGNGGTDSINVTINVTADRAALVALYNATDGANWTYNTNWLTDKALSEWYGVETDEDGRVRELNLNANKLSREIPAALGRLTNLEYLYLALNKLSGTIPAALGRLTNLKLLHLNSNELSGEIPEELGDLTNLQELALSRNTLSGAIPVELGSLTNLEELVLSENELSGEIPAQLGNLTNLQELWLSHNELSGTIRAELGDLTNLQGLYLSVNKLSGAIPAELEDLTNLQKLSLSTNELSGAIPVELGRLTNLQYLWLHTNELSGEIPAELGDLTNLQYLYLNKNGLSEEIPVELGDLTNLKELHLNENELSGEIPAELGDLTNLQELYLHENGLSGEIPEELGDLTNLQELALSRNTLSGEIPAELGNLTNLQHLYLHRNGLSGEIPAPLGGLTNLQHLWLHRNGLSGEIPAELGNLTNLQLLLLNDNELMTGTIPTALANLVQLQEIDVSNTGLCAPADAAFQMWLNTIIFQGTVCAVVPPPPPPPSPPPPPPAPVPDAPTNLLADAGDAAVTFSWEVPEDDGGFAITDYEYRIDQTGEWISIGSTDTTHTVTGLVNGTEYVFQVRAVTAAGGSAPSNRVEATPRAAVTLLVANFMNGNNGAFNSRVYLWNPSTSAGQVTVRVFTLPLTTGIARELTGTPLDLGTLEARSALNLKLVEDILDPLEIALPYTTDGGNLMLEFTIQAVDVRGAAQVFSSDFAFGTYPMQEIPSTSSGSPTVLVANFTNGNNGALHSRVYLWNPSATDGHVTVRVFTLPNTGDSMRLQTVPLGILKAFSARNIRIAEDILGGFLGIALPYTDDGGNLMLEFTIEAPDVKGAAQVFSSDFAFGTYPLQEIPSTSSGSPTVLVANFTNGNNGALHSRVYLWNPSASAGEVTVRVFTLPLTGDSSLLGTLDLESLQAESARNLKLAEDILAPLEIALPYVTDGGNLTLEFTIQAADARGVAQVFSSDFAFGTYPMQEIPSTSSESPTVLVANFMNGNDAALNSRVYLWNPSLSAGSVTVRVFTLPLTAGVAQELTTAPLDLGTLGAESARNLKLVEDILTPLGIPTPYVTDGGNLTLEFTIQAADVRGAAQVFSSSFAFGTVPLQVIQ